MTFRPLLLIALCLGLVAGCSKPPPPSPSEPVPTNNNTPPAPDTKPAPTEGASGGTAGTGSAAEAAKGETVTYIVRDSGIRCIAPPCPSHLAKRVDQPDADAVQIHELDFASLSLAPEKQEEFMGKMTAEGLKVEATLDVRPKAGPAGDATVLRVKKVLE